MPPRPGEGLGEPPPPVPRPLPKGFAFRQKWSSNVLALVGLIFFLVGSLLTVAFLIIGLLVGILLPLLFVIGGLVMLRIGRRAAARTLTAFVRGTAVEGKVFSVLQDHSQTVNGQHPWKLTYHFPVNGQVHEGSLVSFDSTVTLRAPGQPLWILYLPNDPEQNTAYPPLK